MTTYDSALCVWCQYEINIAETQKICHNFSHKIYCRTLNQKWKKEISLNYIWDCRSFFSGSTQSQAWPFHSSIGTSWGLFQKIISSSFFLKLCFGGNLCDSNEGGLWEYSKMSGGRSNGDDDVRFWGEPPQWKEPRGDGGDGERKMSGQPLDLETLKFHSATQVSMLRGGCLAALGRHQVDNHSWVEWGSTNLLGRFGGVDLMTAEN